MHYEINTEGEGRRSLGTARQRPLHVAAGIITTVVLHLGIVIPFVVSAMSEQEAPQEEQEEKIEFEDVKLMKLGKQKPDDQLPQISNPAPATPKEESVTLDEKKKKPEPKREEEPERTQERTEQEPDEEAKTDDPKDLEEEKQKAIEELRKKHRPTNDVPPEGKEQGPINGPTGPPSENAIQTYEKKIWRALGEYWGIPKTIPKDEIPRLLGQVKVEVEISESGHVESHRLTGETDNQQLNETINRVFEEFTASGGGDTLPLPEDDELRKSVLKNGLQLKNWQDIEQ